MLYLNLNHNHPLSLSLSLSMNAKHCKSTCIMELPNLRYNHLHSLDEMVFGT
jgi:hypothetical protein